MSARCKYCIKVSSFFTPENIEFFIGKNTDQIVLKLLENLALNYGIGHVQSIYNSIYKENILEYGCINIHNNCNVFLFRLSNIDNVKIAIGIIKDNVGQPVYKSIHETNINIVLVCPKNKPDIILKCIKVFKVFFSDISNCELLLKMDKPVEVWDFINHSEIILPEAIFANDFMEEVLHTLSESNNLKDAINKFIHSGLLNIPVVDPEGNLVGEVTAHELMEVCLPPYILWMDDIQPIINFEPFQNMLENEENTWLAEILKHDVAVVQKDEPYIMAAIQMTKKEVNHTYVLDDKKLLGIITLKSFLCKILRE